MLEGEDLLFELGHALIAAESVLMVVATYTTEKFEKGLVWQVQETTLIDEATNLSRIIFRITPCFAGQRHIPHQRSEPPGE